MQTSMQAGAAQLTVYTSHFTCEVHAQDMQAAPMASPSASAILSPGWLEEFASLLQCALQI